MTMIFQPVRLCSIAVALCTFFVFTPSQAADAHEWPATPMPIRKGMDRPKSQPPPPPSPIRSPAKTLCQTPAEPTTSQIASPQHQKIKTSNLNTPPPISTLQTQTADEKALATHQRRGRRLALGAGIGIAASLGLGVAALHGVDKRCIKALEGQPESITSTSLDPCIAGEPALIAAGVGAGLTLLASGGLAAGGAWELRLAAREPLEKRARRTRLSLGALLLPLGISAVVASAFVFRVTRECDSVQCLRTSRINDLVVRTLGSTAAIGGAALLGSLGPPRQRRRYARLSLQLRHQSINLGLIGEF